jgi:NADPH:quinone reductase-like Zn-dependent oxidoreductase
LVQLAHALGAGEIVGVCSGRNASFVMKEGATAIVDYTKGESVLEKFGPQYFDVVYDTATAAGGGEDYLEVDRQARAPDGVAVSLNGGVWMGLKSLAGFKTENDVNMIWTKYSREDLATICELQDTTGFIPVVDRVLPFTQDGVDQAFDLVKSRRARGKVVIDLSLSTAASTADSND